MRKEKDINWQYFFQQLLELSNKKIETFRYPTRVATEKTRFWGAKAGREDQYGLDWNYESRGEAGLRVQLTSYYERKKSLNERRVFALHEKKLEIEKAYGESLIWDYKPGRTQQYIYSPTPLKNYINNEAKWPEIQEDLVKRMIRLQNVLRQHVAALDE